MRSIVAHVCDNQYLCWLTMYYIYSVFRSLHKRKIIHQPNSIDVVITMPHALDRWSHTDQLFQFRSDPLTSNQSVKFFQIRLKTINSKIHSKWQVHLLQKLS